MSIPTIDETVDETPELPQRGIDIEDTFVSLWEAWTDHISTPFRNQVNLIGSQFNLSIEAINAILPSIDNVVDTTNFQGEWSGGFNGGLGYSKGMTVNWDNGATSIKNIVYMSTIDGNTDEPPTEPTTTNWIKVGYKTANEIEYDTNISVKQKIDENQTIFDKSRQSVPITFPSDADYTITDEENLYGIIEIQSGVISTQRSLIVSNVERTIIAFNNETEDVLVKTAAGTGVIVKSGLFDIIRCDGTNVVKSISSPFNANSIYALVDFDGTPATPTINRSFNVTDVAKNATGEYDIDHNLGTTNYLVLSIGTNGSGSPRVVNPLTKGANTLTIETFTLTATKSDSSNVNLIILKGDV